MSALRLGPCIRGLRWATLPVALAALCGGFPSAAGATTPVAKTSKISVGRSPVGVAVDTVTHTIYVANSGSDTVSVIKGPVS